ncbi:MAG: isoleucine--tRNA ligase [Pseudomonadota bacterium]
MSKAQFQPVIGRYDGPTLEASILEFWREHDVFASTLAERAGGPRFSFNEGPPTANGKPGIHHVLARTFKDVFPRFKTMQGYYVPRKAGWDTHGLPVEHEIEKKLGIFDKSEIERQIGIAEFTRLCRESVMRYIGDWEKMTERMGFWVNLDEAYYTLNNDYIESVWHLLKLIWDKGLIYRGYKVVPYDPRIGATLSSHELAQGYREVEDPSVFVRFRWRDDPATAFLVWTTTPWTLPSNLALAVHADVDYDFVSYGDETLVVASALRERVFGEREHSVQKTVKGGALVGTAYQRLFDELEVSSDCPAFQVFHADFVTTEDGTGIVHTAPAYGVDDLALGQANGLPVVHGVGLDGHFVDAVTPVAGLFFKDADPILIKLLEERGIMFRTEKYLHNYPFGWRTGDPIIYYAKNAWYIRTTDYKDRLVELNQDINWVPETIRDGRFGNWLDNNVDWALSRERFWGTPLPVWTDGAGNYRCVGSVAELESLTGRELSELDLHRPAVDDIEFTDNGATWLRVPEVIDCWFDSGAMSYAQWHYPFENKDEFTAHFPADYICEAIDQTRGWFYTLHAIATLVSDSVAYRNVICLSHIVDAHGKKMSKSQGNILDPYSVFDKVGADALRWYFLARLAPDVQKRISVEIVADVASSFINTLWNTYAFFVLYARLGSFDFSARSAVSERPEIDRWALALTHQTISDVTTALERFDALAAGGAIESFVDQLSNWYVRRNRRRFWKSDDDADARYAYDTLYECLDALTLMLAPFAPFLAEALYQNLVRPIQAEAPLSVHMASWPVADPGLIDTPLLTAIAQVQKVVGLGRAARAQSGVRTRQPLARLVVRTPDAASMAALLAHARQIEEELNVKAIEPVAPDASLVDYRIKPNLPVVGRKHGKLIPRIKAALAAADGEAIAGAVAAGGTFTLAVDGATLELAAEDVLVETASASGYACAEDAGYLVGLDTTLNAALEREGLARELIRTVQEARKQAGLEVSDRICLGISGSAEVDAALAEHQAMIMSETLAERFACGQEAPYSASGQLGGAEWTIEITRLG